MFKVGDKVLVFRKKKADTYHRRGDYVKGIVLKTYPKFILVNVKNAYKECFFESEVFKYDKDIESTKEYIDRCD